MILAKAKKLALDILFPVACLKCGQGNLWLCPECLKKIDLLKFQVCPFCEKIMTESGKTCSDCKNERPALNRLVVAAKYKDFDLDKIIHLFKYRFVEDLSLPLGEIMAKSLVFNNCPLPDLIIPVPLHPRRLRWRGFNQSELLAEFISENLAPGFVIPLKTNALLRKKYTPPQMKIKSFKDRRKNIKNAFAVKDANEIIGKNILLVDDIATTGSTLFECAQVLKDNGAKKVMAAVISRQEISRKTTH